jgi:hypothetical protein
MNGMLWQDTSGHFFGMNSWQPPNRVAAFHRRPAGNPGTSSFETGMANRARPCRYGPFLGRFVDWSWAQAYHRVGIDYYLKLVSAVPFTGPLSKIAFGRLR